MPNDGADAASAPPQKTETAGRAALLAALAGLPPGRRRVALALVLPGDAPTYPQIAARLGLGLGTVLPTCDGCASGTRIPMRWCWSNGRGSWRGGMRRRWRVMKPTAGAGTATRRIGGTSTRTGTGPGSG